MIALSQLEQWMLEGKSEGLALRDIRRAVGRDIPDWEIKNDLAALKQLGLVASAGHGRGARYDFYRRVYLKLTVDLKVPFSLEKGERKDETPVHEALREALANTLVHADYADLASVLVVKRPDMFGFRNPGLMRIPAAIALQGGESDCRNRTLHKMFRMAGVGEQAGSGIPKIYRGASGRARFVWRRSVSGSLA